MSNLFKALKDGVEGVLEGVILNVRSVRKENRVNVFATVGFPGLFLNFDVFVPERLVPDVVEGRQIQLLPEIKLGAFNRPELKFEVQRIF